MKDAVALAWCAFARWNPDGGPLQWGYAITFQLATCGAV